MTFRHPVSSSLLDNLLSGYSGGNSTKTRYTQGLGRSHNTRAVGSFLLLAVAALPAFAQVGPPVTTGRPTDWTHHRLVFSDPGKLADADAKGNNSHLQAVLHDTRFTLQQMRRNPSLRLDSLPGSGPRHDPKPDTNTIHKDWSVNLSTGLVNPNTYPAKYSFSTTTFSCSTDYVVYPTGIAGATTTQATVVAYNELYGTSGPSGTGCGSGSGGGPVPSVLWEYNTAFTYVATGTGTADGSLVKTSPVLSLLGDQVAFIQVNSSNVASLVLLKPGTSSTVVELNTPALNVANSSYRACTAPCMTRITLSGTTPNDIWSAPFYDYADDTLYVGDDNGALHRYNNVFLSGTPAEASGYPVTLSTVMLASPVYDSTSGYVFVGDINGLLYSVVASSGAIHATSGTLAAAGDGIYDAPLVDSTTEEVYVFVGRTTPTGIGNCKKQACVYQFAAAFTSGGLGLNENLGSGGTSGGEQYVFAGAFDNIYYANSGTVGNLYVVGNAGSGNQGELYRVPFTAGALGAAVGVQVNQSQPPSPSPVTEFCNNGTSPCVSNTTSTTSGTDYIFFSVYNSNQGSCQSGSGDGCVLAFNVNSGAPVFSSFLGESYGNTFNCFVTGGLIVDNAIPSGTEVGASEIYFMGLDSTATNLCATTGSGSVTGVQSAQ